MDLFEVLLDFSQPYDESRVGMFDHLVASWQTSTSPSERQASENLLTRFTTHEASWQAAGIIVRTSKNPVAVFFALKALNHCVETRWRSLPFEYRDELRNFVGTYMLFASASEEITTKNRSLLQQCNKVMVNIIKKEWLDNRWTDVVPSIVQAATQNQLVWENVLSLLIALGEDIFEFDQITRQKGELLQNALLSQGPLVFNLCESCLDLHAKQPGTVRTNLVKAALSCVASYLQWMPKKHFLEGPLAEMLLVHFFAPKETQFECSRVISVLLESKGEDLTPLQLGNLLSIFTELLNRLCAFPVNYWTSMNNTRLVTLYATTLTNFFRNYLVFAENHNYIAQIETGLRLVTRCLKHEDDEIVKICVEFWSQLMYMLVEEQAKAREKERTGNSAAAPLMLMANQRSETQIVQARLEYLRTAVVETLEVMVSKMMRPEEVLVVVDEYTGEVRKERITETEHLQLCKFMRDFLLFASSLFPQDVSDFFIAKLNKEVEIAKNQKGFDERWDFTYCNRLCWAIGSIAGGLRGDEENFVYQVVRNLLTLTDLKRTKHYKAVCASNVMFVCGSFPRYLRTHSMFFKAVLNKLLEFCHEPLSGVQEMAVETLSKITAKCKKRLLALTEPTESSNGEITSIFVSLFRRKYNEELNATLSDFELHVRDLPTELVVPYYEAFAVVIEEASFNDRAVLIELLLTPISEMWTVAMEATCNDLPAVTANAPTIAMMLQVFGAVARCTGIAFRYQLSNIYASLLPTFKIYSELLALVAKGGCEQFSQEERRQFRMVKRALIRLIQDFIEKASTTSNIPTVSTNKKPQQQQQQQQQQESDAAPTKEQTIEFIANTILTPMMEPVLIDYRDGAPVSRDAEVLTLLGVVTKALGPLMQQFVPTMLPCVFTPTLAVIKQDFLSYPDHREAFYSLLRSLTMHCFEGIMDMQPQDISAFIEALLWAIQHHHPQIADDGLAALEEFVKQISSKAPQQLIISFFTGFYDVLLKGVCMVLTDGMHKSGFLGQTGLLCHLLNLARTNALGDIAPLHAVVQFLTTSFCQVFPLLQPVKAERFIFQMVNLSEAAMSGKERDLQNFRALVRNFLVEVKEVAGENDLAVYEREKQQALEKLK